MMSDDIRLLIAVLLPCMTVVAGIIINSHRATGLHTSMNHRFDDLTRFIEARFQLQDEKLYRVEQVLDAPLKHLEDK